MNLDNFIIKTDSYKTSHYKQYPKGTERVYSYFESRVGAKWDETVFFGLQAYIKKYLLGQVVTREGIDEAEAFISSHMGNKAAFNREGWEYILNNHGGRLPIRIKAVPEGTPVSVSNVLMVLENLDDNCSWLTNYLETLLVQVWYASTVATLSRENKRNIKKYLEETSDNPEDIDFRLHDFGYRGVSSDESAGMGGMAHLVNFKGSDTMIALAYAQEFYNANMAGFSIPATEHSTITSWGRDGEAAAMRNMLEQYAEFPVIACVSDSWDIYNACANIWGLELHEKVVARGKDGKILVIRPDSGDPLEVLPKCLEILADRFGYTMNSKGYKVLNYVRLIQGDGITYESIPQILEVVKRVGFSTENLSFGSGGGLLQMLNRDTQRFAFKCSEVTVLGEDRAVFKCPATDSTKASKMGRLALTKDEKGNWVTVKESELNGRQNYLVPVFESGELLVDVSFDQVRANAALN